MSSLYLTSMPTDYKEAVKLAARSLAEQIDRELLSLYMGVDVEPEPPAPAEVILEEKVVQKPVRTKRKIDI